MIEEYLLTRTKAFALQIILLVNTLLLGKFDGTLGKQFLRSDTSAGVNHRAVWQA